MERSFLHRFISFCQERNLVEPHDRILVAVSGGVDSITLLRCLLYIAHPWRLHLVVGHVHHGLRGEEADEDEQFVREIARHASLPFHAIRVDVSGRVEKTGESLEESARVLRYNVLKIMGLRTGCEKIALGHQKNDQVETVLLHWGRGTGLAGFRGMAACRGPFIRPLLFATRQEILRFAIESGVSFREDRSNTDLRFMRNRIRREVIPALESVFGPSFFQVCVRGIDALREVGDDITRMADEAWSEVVIASSPGEITLDISLLLGYFKTIQKEILKRVAEQITGRTSFLTSRDYERLLSLAETGKSGRQLLFHGLLTVVRSGESLVFLRHRVFIAPRSLEINGMTALPEIGHAIVVKEVPLTDLPDFHDLDQNEVYVDRDRIEAPLWVRSMKPGDFFIPLGMEGRKKLHDFFIDAKVPWHRRSQIPIVGTKDAVVWIAGYRIDDRFKIGPRTRRVLRLELIYHPFSPTRTKYHG